MQVKKSLLIAGTVATIGLAGLVGTTAAFATNGGGGNWPGGDSLITKLAERFNLNEADVRAVFNESRLEKESARLQKLVDAGKITAEQKTLIENKIKEIWTAQDQERADLKTWASGKGIDLTYFMTDSKQLQKLVEKGEITVEQKTAIEVKQQALKAKHEAERAALKQWAKDNNIDEKYVWAFKGHGDRKDDGDHDYHGPRR